jgi:hypothetical protein
MTDADGTDEDLKQKADDAIADLPAETAAGNADPAGGVSTDPKKYEDEHAGQYTEGSPEQS